MHDILVYASNFAMKGNGLRYGAELAAALSASLTGVYVAEPMVPLPQFAPVPVPAFPEYVAAVAQIAQEACSSGTEFQTWAKQHGVAKSRWLVAQGYLRPALAAAANWHDLLVLESQAKAMWASVSQLGELLITCGVPCVIVPQSFSQPVRLDTMFIAWDGSTESIRAVHAALPFLKRAKRIVVLDGSSSKNDIIIDYQPTLTIDAELQRHGLAFERRVTDTDGEPAGEAILTAAWEARADLVIMGAYGHPRYSEWIFGGATRHVLVHSQLPMFMRH